MAAETAYTRFLRDPDLTARRAELEAYVGRNPGPFLKMYDRLRAAPEKPGSAMFSFVALAFFLGPVWFFYRKAYAWAWGIVVLQVVLIALPVGRGAGIGLAVALSMIGRYAYLQHAIGRISKLRGQNAVADLTRLAQAGGVSPTAGWVSALAYVGLAALSVLAVMLLDPGAA